MHRVRAKRFHSIYSRVDPISRQVAKCRCSRSMASVQTPSGTGVRNLTAINFNYLT